MDEFQKEVVERLTRIEVSVQPVATFIQIANDHTQKITRTEESLKSAHKRIDELEAVVNCIEEKMYKRAGAIATAIGFVFFLFERLGTK